MAIVTYTDTRAGFGVTYDDGPLTLVHDLEDPRLTAAWADRIGRPIAAAVLFTSPGASAEAIAAGAVSSLLLTTDSAPLEPRALAAWDWDDVTLREGAAFLKRSGGAELESTAVYWRGFPVLQLASVAPPAATAAAPLQLLGMLYTPQQTFTSLLVVPNGQADPWIARLQEVMDGFFLLPLEREGFSRTGHQHVRSQHLSTSDLEGLAAH